MQTLERAIIEPEGWYFIETKLTADGRKKVEELYSYVYGDKYPRNYLNKVYTSSDKISDIETTSTDALVHPVLEIEGYVEDLIENVDYVLEFKSDQSFQLEKLAHELNELHNVMESEMQRLGW